MAGLGAAAIFRAKVALPGVLSGNTTSSDERSAELGFAFILESILSSIDEELVGARRAFKISMARSSTSGVTRSSRCGPSRP